MKPSALLLILLSPFFCLIQNVSAAERPNVLFIMVDDLRTALGCYGDPLVKSPNIDRLAGQGMRFTQMYAGAPVCSSSRCSLMTGMHNGNNRIRDNVPHGIFLRDEDITVTEVLRTAGYRTRAIGKWGLGVHGSQGKPNDQGFDEFYGHTRGEYKQAARFADWKAVRNGSDQPIELYDLKSDPIEAKNIAATHPDELKRAENILATAVTPHPGYRIAPPKTAGPVKRSPAVKDDTNLPK